MASPLTLPRLTINEARARSLIAHHGTDMALRLVPKINDDEPVTEWRLGFTANIPDALRQTATVRATLEWAGARLYQGLPESVCRVWLAARMPDLDLGVLPKALRAVAIETLLSEVTQGLNETLQGGPIRVMDVSEGQRSEPSGLPNAWTLTVCGQAASADVVYATLEADGLGLMLLAGLLSKAPPVLNAINSDDIPVRVCVRLGHASLPATELRTLARHDVLLFDEYYVSPEGELWLTVSDGQGIRVKPDQSTLIVTQGWTSFMTQTSQAASDTDDAGSTTPLDMDAIPVRLTFDLGERQLALGDVRRLQPGETFDLERPIALGAVSIRANGALIGTGELVEIEGRVGVTILTLGKTQA